MAGLPKNIVHVRLLFSTNRQPIKTLMEEAMVGKGVLSVFLVLVLTLSTNCIASEIIAHSTGLVGDWPTTSGGLITFVLDERGMDQDFDGDGLANTPNVIVYFDTQSNNYASTFYRGYDAAIDGGMIVYYKVPENQFAYYDIGTNSNTLIGGEGLFPSISEGRIAFESSDSEMGKFGLICQDDLAGGTVYYYDKKTSKQNCTGATGRDVNIDGDIIAFTTYERFVDEDLNGDGDFLDKVVRYYKISTGETFNTLQVGSFPDVSGALIAFKTSEFSLNMDINGDGQISNVSVIRYYDMATGETLNTGIIGDPAIDGSIIAYSFREKDVNRDIDGDGTIGNKSYIGYYDIGKSRATETGVVGAFDWHGTISGNVITFETRENMIGQDLNGDGVVDYWSVVRYLFIPEPVSIPEIQNSIEKFLQDGTIENSGIAGSLLAFADQAQAMIDGGKDAAAANILKAFQQRISVLQGKKIDEVSASVLIEQCQAVINSLGVN